MKPRIQRHKRLSFLTGIGLAAVVLIVSIVPTAVSAGRDAPPTPAIDAMAAMSDPSLRAIHTPQVVSRLSGEMRAAPGTVRELVADLGRSDLTVWAWQQGASEGICLASTTGGGGCLDAFRRPFDVSISDHDTLGAGDPVAVWGPVTDDVVGVSVTANGKVGQAVISNNIAFFELSDGSLFPSAVEKVVAHLRDGTAVDIRV